jgi:hypothetical protein
LRRAPPPAIAKPKPKAQRHRLLRRGGELLQDWMARCEDAGLLRPWPAVLPTVRGEPVVPLAVGTGPLLRARLNAQLMPGGLFHREWMRQLVTSTAYLRALAAAGSWRHDLDGKEVEQVSDAHRASAATQLASRGCAR